MDNKKIITVTVIVVSLLVVTILIFVNINLLKETGSTPLVESVKKPVESAAPELSYAIPRAVSKTTNNVTAALADRRKAIEESEAELARKRTINRAEAFAKQKAMESSLLLNQDQNSTSAPTTPKKDIKPPSAQEVKDLESKGIISY